MKQLNQHQTRRLFLLFTVLLSYISFTIFGAVIAKYVPLVVIYIDLTILPVALSTVVIIFLFALTYEKSVEIKIPENLIEVGKLYAEGNSFSKIVKEHGKRLGLSYDNDVRRALQKLLEAKLT